MKSKMLLVALVGLTLASGFTVRQDEAYEIKRVPKAETIVRYTIEAKSAVQGQEVIFKATNTERVTSVEEKDNYSIESVQSGVEVQFAGQKIPTDQSMTVTTTFDAKGDVVEIKGDNVDTANYRMASAVALHFPSDKVKAGEGWERKIEANDKKGIVEATASYKLTGTEKIDDWDTLKIDVTYRETKGEKPISCSATIWIDTKDGSLVKANFTVENAPLGLSPEPVSMTATITRQK
jgi:hypothetical protein